ncbi:11812_t:CDS:1, partial [Ambispora leptoticha]
MSTILNDKIPLEIDDPYIKQQIESIEPDLELSIDDLTEPQIVKKGQKPPRPSNAWILFHRNFKACKGQNLSPITTTVEASLHWNELPENKRHAWALLGQIAEQKHSQLYPTYRYQPNKSNKNVEVTGRKKPGPKKGFKKDPYNKNYSKYINVFSRNEQKRKSDSLGDQIKDPEQIVQNASNNFDQQDLSNELNFNVIQQDPMIDNDGLYYSHITTVNGFSENLFSEFDHSSSFISNSSSFYEHPVVGPLSSITDFDPA